MNENFMKRTFDLARFGSQFVRKNPIVGCVLTNNEEQIIGEGYHKMFGGKHAEVNAFESIAPEKSQERVSVYVSLEPCCFVGKTPACTDLITQKNVSKVFISVTDKTSNVNGAGKKILRENGIDVIDNVLEKTGNLIARPRNINALKNRPYIILKWAETEDGFIGKENETTIISNAFAKRLVHKWRSESDAILVGTNTALVDNPKLTNRHYFGPSPTRIVLDRTLKLPQYLTVFNDNELTYVITEIEKKDTEFVKYINLKYDEDLLNNLLQFLFDKNVGKLFIEGGASLLSSFIMKGLYDEVRIIKSSNVLTNGISAPEINEVAAQTIKLDDNMISFYYKS